MKKTIFEKIIDGEISSFKIYDSNNFIAILDINPDSNGHTLLIPKQGKKNILFESNENKAQILFEVNKITKILEEKLNVNNFKLLFNCGSSAGQVISYTHLHIIPFYNEKQPIISVEEMFLKLKKH